MSAKESFLWPAQRMCESARVQRQCRRRRPEREAVAVSAAPPRDMFDLTCLERPVPYAINDELPPSVRDHLPPHAQDIFREAFKHPFGQYSGDESTAFRIAWAAVKRRYEKIGSAWVSKTDP